MSVRKETGSFLQLVKSPWRFKLFLLKRLPMAFLAGLRVTRANTESASVTISLWHLTKNPFRSIYFACQAMAAEFSTGILAMHAIEQTGHPFSLLVVQLQAEFTKKATGTITFECTGGERLIQTAEQCLKDHQPNTCTVTSIGTDVQGATVAKFNVTWSFKPK